MNKLVKDYIDNSYLLKYLRKLKVKHKRKQLQKFLNKNQECSLYLGMPGSGKTTYIAYLVKLVNDCHYGDEFKVFCNVPIEGAYPFSKEDIGIYNMSRCLILLDEAGMVYDNRQFEKQFNEKSLSYLKLIRHYRSQIALFSQSMDIDVKWVRMSKQIFFIKQSIIRGFTSIIKVNRTLDVNPDTHKLEDFYDKPKSFLYLIFHFRFRRKPYYKFFDSWDAPPLKEFPNLPKYRKYKLNIGEK